MDNQDEEKLLREEVSHDEKKEKSDEDKIRDFIGTDFNYKTDNLSGLNINSPKDSSMSDDARQKPMILKV